MEEPDLGVVKSEKKKLSNWFRLFPYLRQFNREVREQNKFCAFPLLSGCWHFVGLELPPTEVRNSIDYNPRDATTKVHNLMVPMRTFIR